MCSSFFSHLYIHMGVAFEELHYFIIELVDSDYSMFLKRRLAFSLGYVHHPGPYANGTCDDISRASPIFY